MVQQHDLHRHRLCVRRPAHRPPLAGAGARVGVGRWGLGAVGTGAAAAAQAPSPPCRPPRTTAPAGSRSDRYAPPLGCHGDGPLVERRPRECCRPRSVGDPSSADDVVVRSVTSRRRPRASARRLRSLRRGGAAAGGLRGEADRPAGGRRGLPRCGHGSEAVRCRGRHGWRHPLAHRTPLPPRDR